MSEIYHALVLNLHQPTNNLTYLLEHAPWEAKEILFAMDRMPRVLWGYENIARVHLSLSGALLETLSDPNFQSRVHGIVKCGDLLWHLQNNDLFDILGTGYYHPVFPLTPKNDWEEHMLRWQSIGKHLFSRPHFSGFWPPEMGFTMEMIPLLKQMGYQFVIVDSEHVEAVDKMSWEELYYRPHIAEYEGEEIIVIVRDRDLSNAQESGMEYEWFHKELNERTKWCNFPPLVTTCTDGDNGGWFRNISPEGNFWHYFYRRFLNKVQTNETNIRPIFIKDYINYYGVSGRVKVHTGAWNTGWHDGKGFVQWTGSQIQQAALQRIDDISQAFHELYMQILHSPQATPDMMHQLEEARWHLLRAETSCHFYWGETWVQRSHDDLDVVDNIIEHIKTIV